MNNNPTLKQNFLKPVDLEKAKTQITVEIIEYESDLELHETVIKKTSGQVSTMRVDPAEVLAEKTFPYKAYVQVIDGVTEMVIAGEIFYLGTGQSIVIPSHVPNYIRPYGGFKMILSMIKDE
ncbi:MAG: hypothetical protein SH818_06905 [Saprospiraceae bacterium]|nr:hypothetical protein [Saprospiraceae bacterium]